MTGSRKAISTIELISAATLMMIITVFLVNTALTATNSSQKIRQKIRLEYEMQNFFDYIYTDIKKNGADILKDENKDILLKYRFERIEYSDIKNLKTYVKSIFYDSDLKKIYILTSDEISGRVFGYTSKNILLEDVDRASKKYFDDHILLTVEISKDKVKSKKSIKFRL